MNIERIINNNVVSARDLEGREVVIMGKGIGFKRKPGNIVPEDLIERYFIWIVNVPLINLKSF